MLIIIVCCSGLTLSSCAVLKQDALIKRSSSPVQNLVRTDSPLPVQHRVNETTLHDQADPSERGKTLQSAAPKNDPPPGVSPAVLVKKSDDPIISPEPAGNPPHVLFAEPSEEAAADQLVENPSNLNPSEALKAREAETEKDIMEEALSLLDESHKYWVNGELENALEMLDQAYALLLDTNGNPDIARQKDDLRLLISRRILAIYNSHRSNTQGERGEIPIITNADVEKEIRLFQTVERDFFISSYQRSMIYRPVILRELRKAGLPEDLSWLPLVESGFKINALSSARALGLWQFIPSTGYKYGLTRDEWIDERMDVQKSTHAAIDYLKDMHGMFGDWLTVLAGYNCGEGRIMRTIAAQHINYLDRFWDLYQRLPNETARYVPRFLATLLIIKDPQKYGMDLGLIESKSEIFSYEEAEVSRCMRLQDIAQKLEISEETLGILNAELRYRMTPDRPYNLKVPPEKAEMILRMVADIPQAERPRSASATVRRGELIKHRVRQGDTLDSIARKYKTSVEAICSVNRFPKQHLVAGQKVNIPLRSSKASGAASKVTRSGKGDKSVHHQVQKGETLASLSRKYHVSVSEIRKNNNLKSDSLRIGQKLRISK